MERALKTMVEVAIRGSAVRAARRQIVQARAAGAPEYRRSVESAKSLFSDRTPARLELFDTLRRFGACGAYALANAAGRSYSNVRADGARLETLGWIERTDDGTVAAPFDAIEIFVPPAKIAWARMQRWSAKPAPCPLRSSAKAHR